MKIALTLLMLLAMYTPAFAGDAAIAKVHLEQVPDDGIQPRLATDAAGRIHLVYFRLLPGEKRMGHYYYRSRNGASDWSDAITVTREPVRQGDAIRKPAIAVDASSRVHVAWFNMNPAVPGAFLYVRGDQGQWSAPTGIGTEHIDGLEAEPAITTHNDTVTIAWHAGDMADEASRRVYAVTSNDGGLHFGEEIAVSDPSLGACACCTLATEYNDRGTFSVAFRSAIEGDGRHMQVMRDGKGNAVSEWMIDSCPVTSNTLVQEWLVFETRGEILEWHHEYQPVARIISGKSDQRQKHPSIAIDGSGHRLVAWSEADGYFKGGKLSLHLVDPSGAPTPYELIGAADRAIADFSVASVAALADGEFLVLF